MDKTIVNRTNILYIKSPGRDALTFPDGTRRGLINYDI